MSRALLLRSPPLDLLLVTAVLSHLVSPPLVLEPPNNTALNISVMITAALKSLSAKAVIWVPSTAVPVPALSPCIGHTFLFLCMSHDFLLKTRHLDNSGSILIAPARGWLCFAWWLVGLMGGLAEPTL